ncbi:MAG: phosphodiester glycosidase family protein [Oscillospiraceae bacterium]|nr:phosphodiester glycosidase family protein [Oscillospiraceae bacterium]
MMTFKKTLSFLLAFALILSVLAPCGVLKTSAETVLYGEDQLEQVTEPVIGASYRLGADVGGTMYYFRHGQVTDTVPYSLVTTDNINHNWAFQVTLEDSINTSEKYEGGFQLCYTNPDGNTARIYCMDVLKDATVAGQTGVMDTGVNTSTPYQNRHSFIMDDLNGLKILRKVGNNNILVITQVPQTVNGETVSAWRMLGVPEDKLGTEGVYPVMLLQEHTHTLGNAVADTANNTVSRSCDCGYTQTVYDCTVSSVDQAVVGESYYLTANVAGTIRYFIHGTVSETSPASLRTSDNFAHNWAFPVTLEAPVEGDTGFQMTYTNPSGNTVRIYCFDSVGSDGVADTGVNSTSDLNKHTFFEDEVNGVKVLRKIGNDCVLAIKELEYSRNVEDADGNVSVQTGTEWRILGVPEAELANEGVYPVVLTQKHEHVASSTTYSISDSGHSPLCWCGAPAAEVAHTYGEVTHDADHNTHSRSCTVCGYTNVIYGHDYSQVNHPAVGNTYYLAANVDGQLLSFISGGVTETSPYSLKTSETVVAVTVQEALEAGQGEFQLVDGSNRYIYSVDAGVGLTTSVNYVKYPEKVSFSMDMVNGQRVIRAYGTNLILAAKYSDAKSAWRIFAVDESELANEGVHPVVLLDEHEHTCGAWTFDTENHTQSRPCTICGNVEVLYGADDKVSMVTEPVIGESYYLVANVEGKIYYFRHGTATDTVPYSLVVTDNFAHNWVRQVTIEDPTTTNEKITTGFQLTYINPTTEATSRIYCYDVLKDATVAGQTGVMDTGINSANYQNRHNFTIQQIGGQYLLHKTGNNNVLAVKQVPQTVNGETVNVWRMLGVAQSELGTEGVYPVMLANVHTHVYGEELQSNSAGHWHVCDCGAKDQVEPHDLDSWSLDAEAQTQRAVCTDCGYEVQVQSPYFDVIESKNELDLGQIVYDEEAAIYAVEGGEAYYLMTEVDGQNYYFRQTNRTALGNSESVTTTAAYSLYSTNDPCHRAIGKIKVVAGYNENTYILTTTTDKARALYVNNEGSDDDIDVGITTFNGASDDAKYIARTECLWDNENGCFYHVEDGVKYVLVLKQMDATYKGTDADSGESVVVESATEWRITAVPEADAVPENGCYPVKLTGHVHNLDASYSTDNDYHWKNCGCGYQDKDEHTVESWTVITAPTETATGSKSGVCTVCGATVTVETPVTVSAWNITLSDNIGVNFVLALAKGDTVAVTVDGAEVPVTMKDNGNGTYNVTIELAAAQMTSEIAIVVNGYAAEKTYSVRGYADVILAGEYTDAVKNLVRYMLVYGSAAQNYFELNLDDLAGNGIEVTLSEPADAELELLDELDGVSFYGASLLHKTRTAVRFYFTADSVEGLTFLVNGNVYEPVAGNGMYYIEVAGINPQDMADTLSCVVTDGTNSLAVKYSPLVYVSRMYNKAGVAETTKSLAQAMYNYYLAAKDYIINTYTGGIKQMTGSQLYEGVTMQDIVYIAAGYGDIDAYAVVVESDANVELKVAAGAWDENTNGDNPADVSSVSSYFRKLQSSGYNVLAMTNGGFFDLNATGSYLPYGMQIVDGVVKQEPTTSSVDSGKYYGDTWFGMTKDGKYVISDTAGYEATYKGNVQQGVGGGRMLMIDGVAQNISSSRDYRTAVGVNADGDLVLVAVEDATYSDICGIFEGLDMEIITVLNLDGGGSTAMYVPGTFYPKAKILGDDGWLPREVADAIAIVEKP